MAGSLRPTLRLVPPEDAPRGSLRRVGALVRRYPKTSLLLAAEVCVVAGAELLAAALVGSAAALLARSLRRTLGLERRPV